MAGDASFLERLRATFLAEAGEHLQVITDGLLRLEQAAPGEPPDAGLLDTIFRAAHSLKGAARAVEARDVEAVCQGIEDTFAGWRQGVEQATVETLDVLHARVERVASLLQLRRPAALAAQEPAPAANFVAVAPAAPAAAETVRVPLVVLEARLAEAEELLALKLAAGERAAQLQELARSVRATGPASLRERVEALARAAEQDRLAAARLADELLGNAKQLLQLPFAQLAAGLPKLVRDLCREQGKEAALEVEGGHVEFAKRLQDALRDPLVHLLRNAVDHGVEVPAARLRQGKPPRARLRLAAHARPSGRIRITLTDDGAGIDAQRVRAAAVAAGVLGPSEAAALDDDAARALVFRSGLSTRAQVTELSGRGLGLAIVQDAVSRLGGQLAVSSVPGAGTEFRIELPAQRATFRGVLVQAGGRPLLLPTSEVERAVRVRPGDLRTVEGRDAVVLEGALLPVAALATLLGWKAVPPPSDGLLQLVLVGSGDDRVALAVEDVLLEQEFLVKRLPPPMARVRHVAGAALLGDGRLALILRVPALLRTARGAAGTTRLPAPPPRPAKPATVLVAEDSITSRLLLQGVLEAAGFQVTTAVDGADALARLQAEPPDLLVSDVEMPRLDGFALTERVRADPRLARLPVVLVTAREAPAERARGLAAGADAYIGKGGFGEGTLLDIVRSLL